MQVDLRQRVLEKLREMTGEEQPATTPAPVPDVQTYGLSDAQHTQMTGLVAQHTALSARELYNVSVRLLSNSTSQCTILFCLGNTNKSCLSFQPTLRCCSSDRLFENASCMFIQLNVEIEQKMNSILLQNINWYVVLLVVPRRWRISRCKWQQ